MAKKGVKECIAQIRKIANIEENQANNRYLEQLTEKIEQAVRKHRYGVDKDLEMTKSVHEYLNRQFELDEIQNTKNASNQIQQLITNENNINVLEKMLFRAKGGPDVDKLPYALQALLVGVQDNVKQGVWSVDRLQRTVTNQMFGKFINNLWGHNLDKKFTSGKHDKNIFLELYELDGGTPGITKDKDALEMAKIIWQTEKYIIQQLNQVGAVIPEKPGMLFKNSYDPWRMTGGWKDLARTANDLQIRTRNIAEELIEIIDLEKTFPGTNVQSLTRKQQVDNIAAIVSSIMKGEANLYKGLDSILTGKNFLEQTKTTLKGKANMMSRVDIFIFKNPELEYNFMKKYGYEKLTDNVLRSIEFYGNNIGLMRRLGPDPKKGFDALLSYAKKRINKHGGQKAQKEIEGGQYERWWKELSGENHKTASHKITTVFSIWRGLQIMVKLGLSVFSAQSDTVFISNTMKRNFGQNLTGGIFKAYGSALDDISRKLGGTKAKAMKMWAMNEGIGLDGQIGALVSKFSGADTAPGGINKIIQGFFRLNSLQWWNDSQATGVFIRAAHALDGYKNLSMKELRKQNLRVWNMLHRHGIDEVEWEIIRTQAITEVPWQKGQTALLPERINELSDDIFEELWIRTHKKNVFKEMIEANNKEQARLSKMSAADIKKEGWQIKKTIEKRTAQEILELSELQIKEEGWKPSKSKSMSAATKDQPGKLEAEGRGNVPWERETISYVKTVKRERKITKRELEDSKWLLAQKLSSMYQNIVDTGLNIPRAWEKSIGKIGRKGEVGQELLTSVLQFKTFPIAVGAQHLAPAWKHQTGKMGWTRGNTLREQFKGSHKLQIAQLIAASTLMGYWSATLKDLARGKTPMELKTDDWSHNWRIIRKSMIQGGALSFWGDTILGDYNMYGKSFTSTMLGPALGQFDTIMAIGDDPGRASWRLFKDNLAIGSNLWWSVAIQDMLIYNELNELISPGYHNRVRKRIMKDLGQEQFFRENVWR